MTLISHTYLSPLGDMMALLSPQGLCLLEFSERTKGLGREIAQVNAARGGPAQAGENALTRQLGKELAEYFAGKRRNFDVPLDLVGTPFQQDVWRALLTIPYGQTRSYAVQAGQVGKPTAMRAVAAANGANKISIVVPCHRVIGSDGSLTGYGGGVPRKHWLLALERGEQPLPTFA